MSLEIKNVILLGGTSILGKRFFEYISTIPHPFNVTITTRSPTTPPSWFPSSPRYKAINVDYTSHSSLVSALKGQDAAVSLLTYELLHLEQKVVDAAIEAGVKLFIPSEFGIDTSKGNPKLGNLLALPVPPWTTKSENSDSLAEKVKAGKIYSITIVNSSFFEWGLKNGLIGFDIKERKATIFHGGDKPKSAITTNKLGESIARLLLNPTPYLNTTIRLTTIAFTQNQLLHLLETKTGVKWTVENTTSLEAIESGKELTRVKPSVVGFLEIVKGVIYDYEETYAPKYTRKDADVLGLEQDDLERVVDVTLAEVKAEAEAEAK